MTEELKRKIDDSIKRLQHFEPKNGEGYWLAFGGGKDSCVIKALADMAGVKYEAHYRWTSVDPPELVTFIREHHADVSIDIPRYEDGTQKTMWNLIPKKKMPPTRIARYCCQELKEDSGDGRKTITGVRWAESIRRKNNQGVVTVLDKRKHSALADDEDFKRTQSGGFILVNDNDDSRMIVEQCYKRKKTTVNPIIDWTDEDVWDFIHEYKIPYCSLYDEGFKRIGCIGCPMARTKGREVEFARWPKHKQAYIRAFDKMLDERKMKDLQTEWENGQDVFNWWMEYDTLPNQINMFGEEGE